MKYFLILSLCFLIFGCKKPEITNPKIKTITYFWSISDRENYYGLDSAGNFIPLINSSGEYSFITYNSGQAEIKGVDQWITPPFVLSMTIEIDGHIVKSYPGNQYYGNGYQSVTLTSSY